DDYKELFFKYRNMKKGDLGPQLDERKELREKLQCKPFSWFLEKICRDLYIPDEDTEVGNMYSLGGAGCITGGKEQHGPALLAECTSGGEQKIEFTSQNYMQVTAHVNHHLVCLRTQMVAQVPCRKGTQWQLEGKELHSLDREGFCLTRSPSGEAVDLVKCKALARQQWSFEGKGVLSGPAGDLCVDNMQRTSGPPGLYGCHGGTTQQWILDPDHRLRSGGVIQPSVAIAPCVPEDDAFAWLRRSTTQHDRLGMQTFSPRNNPELCLVGQDHKMRLGECEGDQKFWKYPFNVQAPASAREPSARARLGDLLFEPLTAAPRVTDIAHLAEELQKARAASVHQTRMEVHRAEALGALESKVSAVTLRLEDACARIHEAELGLDAASRGGLALRLRLEQLQSSVELRLTSLAGDLADVVCSVGGPTLADMLCRLSRCSSPLSEDMALS
ncbi:unnamed protein product, partial [Effrenium voratum]